MSQSFKLKFDEMKGSDPTVKNIPAENDAYPKVHLYETEGTVRNVCFVVSDERRIFLNYAYLVSGEYLNTEQKIILSFTTHTVTLKGIYLETLFALLMVHKPKYIIRMDERYNVAEEKVAPIVNDIQVVKTSE